MDAILHSQPGHVRPLKQPYRLHQHGPISSLLAKCSGDKRVAQFDGFTVYVMVQSRGQMGLTERQRRWSSCSTTCGAAAGMTVSRDPWIMTAMSSPTRAADRNQASRYGQDKLVADLNRLPHGEDLLPWQCGIPALLCDRGRRGLFHYHDPPPLSILAQNYRRHVDLHNQDEAGTSGRVILNERNLPKEGHEPPSLLPCSAKCR
jgi:hypothetical protein